MSTFSSRISSIPTTPTLIQALSRIPLPCEEEVVDYTDWRKDAGMTDRDSDFNSYEAIIGQMFAFCHLRVVKANTRADQREATDLYLEVKLPDGTRSWIRVNVSGNTSAAKMIKCYERGVVPLQVNVGDIDDERLLPNDVARVLYKSIKRMVVDAGVKLAPVPSDRVAKLEALLAAQGHAA